MAQCALLLGGTRARSHLFTVLQQAGARIRHSHTLAYEAIRCAQSEPATTSGAAAAQPQETALLLHGLMGSGRNMRSFARALGGALSQATHKPWDMVLVDLRCHGNSARLHGVQGPHTIQSAASDVASLIQTKFRDHPPRLLIGHSLGGKVAMELLRQLAPHTAAHSTHSTQQQQATTQHDSTQHGTAAAAGIHTDMHQGASGSRNSLPKQAWILDSQPGLVAAVQDSKTGVSKVLQTVQDIPLPIPSRQWLTNHLQHARGLDLPLAQWLASSVIDDGKGHLVWAFNVPGVVSLYHDYLTKDYWPVLQRPPPGVDLHLVVGEKSDRFGPALLEQLKKAARQGSHQQANGGLGGAGPASVPASAAQQEANAVRGAAASSHTAAQQGGPQNASADKMAGADSHRSQQGFVLHVLPKSGHNLHMDNPKDLVHMIVGHVTS